MKKGLIKILLIFILGIALSALLAPQVLAFTQTYKDFLNQAGTAGTYNTGLQGQDSYFESLLGRVIKTIIGFTGLIFLVMTIYAGIQWMTASGNEEKVTEAKKRIGHTVIGLVITLMAFILTNTLFTYFDSRFLKQPDLGVENPPVQNMCNNNTDCENNALGFKCIILDEVQVCGCGGDGECREGLICGEQKQCRAAN